MVNELSSRAGFLWHFLGTLLIQKGMGWAQWLGRGEAEQMENPFARVIATA